MCSILALISYLVGVIMGVIISRVIHNKKSIEARLVINSDDPTKDIFSFEFDEPIASLYDKKTIIVKIENSRGKQAL